MRQKVSKVCVGGGESVSELDLWIFLTGVDRGCKSRVSLEQKEMWVWSSVWHALGGSLVTYAALIGPN